MSEEIRDRMASEEIISGEETAETQDSAEEMTAEGRERVRPERTFEQTVAALEALLFSTGEAVSSDRLMTALGISRESFEEAITELTDRFSTDDHGITIVKLENAYQMCTKTEYYEDLIALEVAPKQPTLSDVALETLSIIAYKQPVTRAEVERIRGVNSDRIINKLVEYDLVRELGRLNAPGRPILFGTTEAFLRSFGMETAADLPQIDSVRAEDFKAEAEEEIEGSVGV